MAIKRISPENPENKKPQQEPVVDIEAVMNSLPPDLRAAIETDNAVEIVDDDPGPAFPDPPERVQPQQQDMAVHSNEFYDDLHGGFTPAIEVSDKNGRSKTATAKVAKPATEIDLEHLDESMIMNMPEIKAAAFQIMDILDPKPKDKTLRFRWANYKNFVAGNLGRYLAIGFQVASIDDIDQKRTPIDPSMIDGTQIKWYDVILIKVSVIRLMELYKSNIIKSVNKLEKAKSKGLAEANREFQSSISETPGAARAYKHYKQALGKEPVEFFATE